MVVFEGRGLQVPQGLGECRAVFGAGVEERVDDDHAFTLAPWPRGVCLIWCCGGAAITFATPPWRLPPALGGPWRSWTAAASKPETRGAFAGHRVKRGPVRSTRGARPSSGLAAQGVERSERDDAAQAAFWTTRATAANWAM